MAKRLNNVKKERGEEIYKLLKQDHNEFKAMLKKLEKMGNSGEKEDLFIQFRQELLAHAKAEEQVFYDRLKKAEKTKKLVLEGAEEHAIAEHLVKKLSTIGMDEDRWPSLLKVLRESLEHHIEDEEGDVFPKAKKIFSKDEALMIGQEFSEEKQRRLQGTEYEVDEKEDVYSSEEDTLGFQQ